MYSPLLFKEAGPCALAVISDLVTYKIQCHSSTIGVGTSVKVGAFHIRVAGQFVLHSDMGVIYLFHSPSIMFLFGLACHDPVQ